MTKPKLSKTQQEVIDYLAKDKNRYIVESPYHNCQKICAAMGNPLHYFTKSTLKVLIKKGAIVRDPGYTSIWVLPDVANRKLCRMFVIDICSREENHQDLRNIFKKVGAVNLAGVKWEDLPQVLKEVKELHMKLQYRAYN